MVRMLPVLVSTMCNSQEFLLKKCEKLLQMESYSHFFSQNINIGFNDTLTNDIFSIEQLGPDVFKKTVLLYLT